MRHARIRNQSPLLAISRLPYSTRCNTCCPLRQRNHMLDGRTLLSFVQPSERTSFGLRTFAIQLLGDVNMLGAIKSEVKVRTPLACRPD